MLTRRARADALASDDVRWALELSTWLVRSQLDAYGRLDGGSAQDRAQLAAVLRTIAQRTTAANIRGWCLTRALELLGRIDLSRMRSHNFRAAEVVAQPADSVRSLRVLLDPQRAENVDSEFRIEFEDGASAALRIRRGVAVPTPGDRADVVFAVPANVWGQILAAKQTLDDAFAAGHVVLRKGQWAQARTLLACFDHPSLAAESR